MVSMVWFMGGQDVLSYSDNRVELVQLVSSIQRRESREHISYTHSAAVSGKLMILNNDSVYYKKQ